LISGRAYLPEPFLWEVFYYLVEVAVAMRDGPPDGHWNFQVVHLDIKPENGESLSLAPFLLQCSVTLHLLGQHICYCTKECMLE